MKINGGEGMGHFRGHIKGWMVMVSWWQEMMPDSRQAKGLCDAWPEPGKTFKTLKRSGTYQGGCVFMLSSKINHIAC